MADTPLKVLIIGCGNIAGRFDMQANSPQFLSTHAGAYTASKYFDITACIDPNNQLRSEFIQHWKIPYGFSNWGELLKTPLSFDIISICSPTEHHNQDIEQALSLKPKLIFCEKPVNFSAVDTRRLRDHCATQGVLFAVNYTRRWDPCIRELKQSLSDQQYGALRSVIACYNKGILNNGSHLIDLLHLLFNELTIQFVGEPVFDYSDKDPSLCALLSTPNNTPVHLVCGHAEDYSLFELQFIFAHGILSMQQNGLMWHQRNRFPSEQFKGYHLLDTKGEYRQGGYPATMSLAVNNLALSIRQGEILMSDINNALKTQELCEAILNFNPSAT